MSAAEFNRAVSSKLEEIIQKALEKDRDLRYQHAAEIRADLQRLKRDTDSGSARATTLVKPAPGRYAWVRWTLVALVMAGILAWTVAHRHPPTAQNPLTNA